MSAETRRKKYTEEKRVKEKLTGEMTCEVNGSASCKNKMIENWAQGSGVFLTIPDPRLGLVLPTTLDARLTWFEGLANVATSESGSVTPPIAERCSPCNRGVSSSGTVGVVMVMGVRSVGEGYTEETGGGNGKRRWEKGDPSLSVLR